MKYKVQFEVRFEVEIECDPEALDGMVADLAIPEDDQTKYVEDTFEVFSIEDEDGKDVY